MQMGARSRSLFNVVVWAVALTAFQSCDCWGKKGSAAKSGSSGAAAIAGCGSVVAAITGQISVPGTVNATDINGTLALTDAGSNIEWVLAKAEALRVTGGSGTAVPLDSTKKTAADTLPTREIDLSGSQNGYKLKITGKITGPPPPCHGSGSWSLEINGSNAGGGTWSF